MCAQSLHRELDTWKARNLHNINPEYWTDFLLPLVLCTVACFFFTPFVFIQTAGCKSVWFASGEMESPTIPSWSSPSMFVLCVILEHASHSLNMFAKSLHKYGC